MQRYSLTFCTDRRHHAFTDCEVVAACVSQLRQRAARHAFAVPAYCFMPDHAHVLACGTEDGSDLQVFATAFKSATAYRYRARADRRLWQPGYFERVLRSEEATDTVARYILENPIRAGLARLVGEYPFAGSFVHDATALLDLWRDGTRD